jgi:hypothetical protein
MLAEMNPENPNSLKKKQYDGVDSVCKGGGVK